MSKLITVMDVPTGVTFTEGNVRVTPTEEGVRKFVAVRGGFEFQVQNPDGTWTEPAKNTVVTTASGPAALLYDPKKDVVGLIDEFRLAAWFRDIEDAKQGILNRPAGRGLAPIMGAKAKDELMETAALREILEESGYASGRMWKGPEVLKDRSIAADKLGFFIGEFDSSKAANDAKTGIDEEVGLITFRMMPSSEFIDRAVKGEMDTVGMAIALVFQNNRSAIQEAWLAPSEKAPAANVAPLQLK